MNVGILSMQRVINYGSFLQAYSLKQTLSLLGHTVEFLDIESNEHIYRDIWPYPKWYMMNRLKSQIHRICGQKSVYEQMNFELSEQIFYYRLYNQYPSLWHNYLGMNEKSNISLNYDALVIGSDEVFNCAQESDWGQTMKLFGEGFVGKCLVSYAASFAQTSLADLNRLGIREHISRNLLRFSGISVRDEHSKKLVMDLIGVDPLIHLDPVLIYDYPEIDFSDNISRTLIIYAYPNRICDPALVQEIILFAHKHDLKIVSIGAYYSWAHNLILTPFEVLKAFQKASYIITDTFHGTIFSLKYQKQFATIVRESNSNKLLDLLRRFNLSNRVVKTLGEIDRILEMPYDHNEVLRLIEIGKNEATSFLREVLNK